MNIVMMPNTNMPIAPIPMMHENAITPCAPALAANIDMKNRTVAIVPKTYVIASDMT